MEDLNTIVLYLFSIYHILASNISNLIANLKCFYMIRTSALMGDLDISTHVYYS